MYSTHRYCKSIAIVGYCVAIATTMPNQSIMGHPLSPPDRRSTAPFSRGDYYGGARAACQTTGSVRTLSEGAYRFLTKTLPRNRRFRPLQASDLQVFIFRRNCSQQNLHILGPRQTRDWLWIREQNGAWTFLSNCCHKLQKNRAPAGALFFENLAPTVLVTNTPGVYLSPYIPAT